MRKNNTNLNKENVKELMKGLCPFPQNIFIAEQPWLSDYMLPLISIDMGLLRKDLQGTVVHMINPIEPFDGLLGERTTEFHNEFCCENWIAFELTQDNKYRFLADEKYFELADKGNIYVEYKNDIEEKFSSYQKYKENYQKTGKLFFGDEYVQDDETFLGGFLEHLGGEISYGNWVCYDSPTAFENNIEHIENLYYSNHELKKVQERLSNNNIPFPKRERQKETEILAKLENIKNNIKKLNKNPDELKPLAYKGNEFIYVADVAGYSYCSDGADSILMFYEPKSRIVLFTFDWS